MSRYTDQHGLPCFSDGPVVGVDEAGRGPLAGPVVAAAVMFPAGARLEGLGDSKLLSESVRLALVAGIRETAIGWAVAWADPAASVVGQKFGKRPFLAGTVRGTATCAVVAFCALLLFVPWWMALLAAAVTAMFEAAPLDLDDNLIVPITAAGTLYLMGFLT